MPSPLWCRCVFLRGRAAGDVHAFGVWRGRVRTREDSAESVLSGCWPPDALRALARCRDGQPDARAAPHHAAPRSKKTRGKATTVSGRIDTNAEARRAPPHSLLVGVRASLLRGGRLTMANAQGKSGAKNAELRPSANRRTTSTGYPDAAGGGERGGAWHPRQRLNRTDIDAMKLTRQPHMPSGGTRRVRSHRSTRRCDLQRCDFDCRLSDSTRRHASPRNE